VLSFDFIPVVEGASRNLGTFVIRELAKEVNQFPRNLRKRGAVVRLDVANLQRHRLRNKLQPCCLNMFKLLLGFLAEGPQLHLP
jgi:hypothetical protein